jgi:hypothetical protein
MVARCSFRSEYLGLRPKPDRVLAQWPRQFSAQCVCGVGNWRVCGGVWRYRNEIEFHRHGCTDNDKRAFQAAVFYRHYFRKLKARAIVEIEDAFNFSASRAVVIEVQFSRLASTGFSQSGNPVEVLKYVSHWMAR